MKFIGLVNLTLQKSEQSVFFEIYNFEPDDYNMRIDNKQTDRADREREEKREIDREADI